MSPWLVFMHQLSKHQNMENRIFWLKFTAGPPFICRTIDSAHQPVPRKAAKHLAVCYTHAQSSLSPSWCQIACQKWELFFVEHGRKVNRQYCCDILLYLSYYQSPWMKNFIFQQNTAHRRIRHEPQSNCYSAKLHSSIDFWRQTAQSSTHWLQDLRSHIAASRVCESQVNNSKENKHRLVQVWQSSNTTFMWKCDFRILPGHAEESSQMMWKNKPAFDYQVSK